MRTHRSGLPRPFAVVPIALIIACALLLTPPAIAGITLPSIFGDAMVLQRDRLIPVWGTTDGASTIEVAIGGESRTATPNADGSWRVDLPPMPAGGPHELKVSTPGETRVFRDILIGEVWICSGQSNMEWPLRDSIGGADAIDGPHDDRLRLFRVENAASAEPVDDVNASWARSSTESAAPFSGVAFFMGRRLREELGVPVGLIHTAFGGSPAEAWASRGTLESSESLRGIVEDADRRWDEFVRTTLAPWREEADRKRARGEDPGPEPQGPFGWMNGYRPTGLYNAMLEPMAPFAVAGAVWYQGESNVGRHEQYRELLPAMIADWRDAFEHPEMPFGIVQLANFADPYPNGGSWPALREAQMLVADADPHAGLVVTIDRGNPTDIHPRDKHAVGDRLARWALDSVYGVETPHRGPVCTGMDIDGKTITLTFDTGGRGLATRDGEPPNGFAIGSASGGWVWARTSRLEGDTVVLTVKWMTDAAKVRYAWDNNPDWANLCDEDGLPARPFRTVGPVPIGGE